MTAAAPARQPKRWPGARPKGGKGSYILADASFAPIAGNLKAWPRLARNGEGFGRASGQGPGELRRYPRPIGSPAERR